MSTKTQERAAMSRLIDTFGAEVLVNLVPPPTLKSRERMAARSIIEDSVEGCKACGLCELRADSDRIGPEFPSLTATMHLTVLTEFPVDPNGRYGRLLTRALRAADIDLAHVAWCSVVNCIPRHPGGALRAASRIERDACRFHLIESLAAAGAPNVLIIGDKAMKAWRSDLRIEQVVGTVGVWNNRYMVTVVPHPASATGQGELKEWSTNTTKAAHNLMHETVGGIGERCIAKECGRRFFGFDQDALPWCEEHLAVRPKVIEPSFVNERLW